MREIKFRVWDSRINKMLYPNVNAGHLRIGAASWGIWENDLCLLTDASGVLMQYTGQYDQNDNQICEGDIVKEGAHLMASVKFKNGAFHFGDLPFTNQYIEFSTMEVIGNIYENPELLK